MNISPRKDEYAPVVALLESDQFDSAAALAKAVVKTVYDELLKRDWTAWVYRFPSGGPVLAVGPFTSDSEAAKYGKKSGLDGEHMILTLSSPYGEHHGDVEARAMLNPPMCSWCGHPKHTHAHQGYAGKCAVGHCSCPKFK